jgi:hypothetical protein
MNSKNKIIKNLHRGINEFKRSYQLRSVTVKDGNRDMLSQLHAILNR